MLEPENELYNTGIVDKSHRYPKMYVIRPQFFIPMITILRNAAFNSMQYKNELQLMRNQNIDITHFEENMNDFKEKFSRIIGLHQINLQKLSMKSIKLFCIFKKQKKIYYQVKDNCSWLIIKQKI